MLLPPMVLFLFGMVAAGQVILAKYQVAQASAVIGRAVLDEPSMSDQNMANVVVGAVAASTQMGGTPKVGARSFGSTPPSIAQLRPFLGLVVGSDFSTM